MRGHVSIRTTLPYFVAVVLAVTSACGRTASSEWPTRPVKLIVPFGPGSGQDVVARLLAPRLSAQWAQPVVVDNRPGADGIVGVQAFAAATDHHTLLFTPAGQVTLSPLLHERLPFDPVADLVPIAAVVNPSIGIATTSSTGGASLSDLVRRARQEPDRLKWAAPPGLPEVIFKAFLAIEKLQMKHVPYRDMSVALQDLGAERIQVLVTSVPTLSPLLQSGRARLLVVTTSARISAAPEVPTTTEAGYPALSADGKWGFYGWRDIPDGLRGRISQDIRLALDDPALIAKLSNMGLTLAPGTAEEFTRALDHHRKQVREMAWIIGLKPSSSDGGR
jgi:tripartite-type tricarboxylate transporter receptor subunit TctC